MRGAAQQTGGDPIHADDTTLLDGSDNRPNDQGEVDIEPTKDHESSGKDHSWVSCEGTRHKQTNKR